MALSLVCGCFAVASAETHLPPDNNVSGDAMVHYCNSAKQFLSGEGADIRLSAGRSIHGTPATKAHKATLYIPVGSFAIPVLGDSQSSIRVMRYIRPNAGVWGFYDQAGNPVFVIALMKSKSFGFVYEISNYAASSVRSPTDRRLAGKTPASAKFWLRLAIKTQFSRKRLLSHIVDTRLADVSCAPPLGKDIWRRLYNLYGHTLLIPPPSGNERVRRSEVISSGDYVAFEQDVESQTHECKWLYYVSDGESAVYTLVVYCNERNAKASLSPEVRSGVDWKTEPVWAQNLVSDINAGTSTSWENLVKTLEASGIQIHHAE